MSRERDGRGRGREPHHHVVMGRARQKLHARKPWHPGDEHLLDDTVNYQSSPPCEHSASGAAAKGVRGLSRTPTTQSTMRSEIQLHQVGENWSAHLPTVCHPGGSINDEARRCSVSSTYTQEAPQQCLSYHGLSRTDIAGQMGDDVLATIGVKRDELADKLRQPLGELVADHKIHAVGEKRLMRYHAGPKK